MPQASLTKLTKSSEELPSQRYGAAAASSLRLSFVLETSLYSVLKVRKSDENCFCHLALFPHTHRQLAWLLLYGFEKRGALKFLAQELPLPPILDITEMLSFQPSP